MKWQNYPPDAFGPNWDEPDKYRVRIPRSRLEKNEQNREAWQAVRVAAEVFDIADNQVVTFTKADQTSGGIRLTMAELIGPRLKFPPTPEQT